MPPVTHYATTRDGRKIAWSVVGDGPIDLLYIPQSISAMEHIWDHPTVTAFFARLASFSRLILFDRRGSGMSERQEAPVALEEQMDDVIAVLDAAGSERAALMALYEGGPMGMLFAATVPERVSHLAVYAGFARTIRGDGYPIGRTAEERATGQRFMHSDWGTGDALTRIFAPGYVGDRRMTEWLGRLQRLAMDPRYGHAVAMANEGLDIRCILPSIRVPTLVMHRRHDSGFDIAHSEYLAEHIPGAQMCVLEGNDSLPFLGDSEAVAGELEEFVTGGRREQEADRILATVLFTDIVRSTERAAELGDARWRSLLEQHDAAILREIGRHRGKAIKSNGDGYLATFDGPARAIRAAQGIVGEVSRLGLEVRAGLHTGECEVIGDDVGGMAVHIAARVMAGAGAREVRVSNTVKDLVVGSELRFEDRGEHDLKGVPGPWHLWAVAGAGA